jgi:hypothetical protein
MDTMRQEYPLTDDNPTGAPFIGRQRWRWLIWDLELSPTCKLVALAMLERANEYGVFDDPQRVLADMTGYTVRTVRAALTVLKAASLVAVLAEDTGRPTVWQLANGPTHHAKLSELRRRCEKAVGRPLSDNEWLSAYEEMVEHRFNLWSSSRAESENR